MTFGELFCRPEKYRRILKLAGPLVLSQSGLVLMQFVDAVFLAWYAPEAVAASGAGGMVSWLFASLVVGIVGYTSVLTSNDVGARKDGDIGSAVWQGIHVSVAAGALTAAGSALARPFFLMVGHGEVIAGLESDYLGVLMLGSVLNYMQTALAGFFSGRGDNVRLMLAQVAGQLLNVFLDWALIFGRCGLPRLGVTGAALATVAGTGLTLAILFRMFLAEGHRRRFHTLDWRPRLRFCRHLLRFGVATGVQLFIDAGLWTVFLVLIGRIGPVELAATTIALRINSLAFSPVLGIGRAMSTVVGQSHGARRHEETVAYIAHGCVVAQTWMTLVSLSYWLFTAQYLGCFRSDGGRIDFQPVYDTGYRLLRFVSVYCLVDGINITMSFSLHAVGDTNWPMAMVSILTAVLVAVQIAGVALGGGLYFVWTTGTLYIMLMPIMWIHRLRQGRWRSFVVAT